MSKLNYVIVDKKAYKNYLRMQDLKENLRTVIVSKNLESTKASQFMDKVQSGDNLLKEKIPRHFKFDCLQMFESKPNKKESIFDKIKKEDR